MSLGRNPGESKSYAVGHFALGYLLAKASAKLGKVELNIPIVLTLAIIPDADLLIPMIPHRGPSHSIVAIGLIFVPIFAAYRRRAIPYFLALIQHFLIGDYLASGQVQLLWPITTQYYGTNLSIRSPTSIAAESAAFLLSLIVMLRTGDISKFLKPHTSNLILAVPLFTVLLPTFVGLPLDVPLLLMPQHLFYTILFTMAIISTLHKTAKTVMTRRYSGSPSFLLNSEQSS
jgi:membrane-bound metal-dependent hydrolase YbcI (DUF457 family)